MSLLRHSHIPGQQAAPRSLQGTSAQYQLPERGASRVIVTPLAGGRTMIRYQEKGRWKSKECFSDHQAKRVADDLRKKEKRTRAQQTMARIDSEANTGNAKIEQIEHSRSVGRSEAARAAARQTMRKI